MKCIRKFISVFCVGALILSQSAFASVLGSSKITGYSVKIGEGTTFSSNVFYSDQKGVGQQTENYITYSPNSSVVPVITNGAKLFGTTKISNEVKRLSGENLVAGINADYFSFQTGVPMSNLIVDGKIVTKDASGQDSIGIMEDGTAFMAYATFASVLIKEDGSETNIYNINKYRQPYAIYMMDERFSDTTQNKTKGIDVILGSVEGEMRLGTKLTAVVESVEHNSSAISIPSGKIVLTVDEKAPAEFLDPIASLAVGEKVTISFGAVGDKRWESVKLGMGCVGGKLLTNGEINSNLAAGAAPRTALGLKEDGSLILYTIDGRKPGHSYGVQLKTLAARLKELGCKEAINLDGGGSTSIVSLLPGESLPAIKNVPSEGTERSVSTFFFLKNTLSPTGEIGSLTFYPLTAYMLKGATAKFELKATDTSFYPMELPQNIKFSIEGEGKLSEITQDGVLTAKDSGVIRLLADYRGVQGVIDVNSLETPTDIKIKNPSGAEYKTITLNSGEAVQLEAEAYGGYNKLICDNTCFKWEVSPELGEINENGFFKAKEYVTKSGELKVSAGKKTVSVPVVIGYNPNPEDVNNYPKADFSLDTNLLSGKISTPYGMAVMKDGIKVMADGRSVDFEYNEETGELSAYLPAGAVKAAVFMTNITGFSSVKFINADEYTPKSGFADTKGHWAEKELSYMLEKGIINGEQTDSGLLFRPQKQMTRSEFAVMICNYLGINRADYEAIELPFADSEKIPKWAESSIKALYSLKLLSGKTHTDGKVYAEPQSTVTRAEAAVIISRTLPDTFHCQSFSFGDKGEIPDWAEQGMKKLVGIGALNGYSDGTIKPLGYLTKAEAAKLLYNIM